MKSLQALTNLENKSAIITNGAKGVGPGICYRLAEAGAKLLIADSDETAVQTIAQELTNKGWTAEPLKVDVTNEEDVKLMVNTCMEKFGSLHILVNNVGIYPPPSQAEIPEEQYYTAIRLNLRTVHLSTKYAVEIMEQYDGGKIINISSIDAMHLTAVGLTHYDASKQAVWGFTKSSAMELAEHKIWINAIASGGIVTPGTNAANQTVSAEQIIGMTQTATAKIPMRRLGEPDDVAKVALFLASDMSSYMTGQQIIVDGGLALV